MTKILMVCLGNICRSPLAEGILKSKLDKSLYSIDSAGLGNYHVGELPDKRSIQVANENLIDITDQRARQFEIVDFEKYDIIYCMDYQNYIRLMALAKTEQHQAKIKMILDEIFPGEHMDVPDPYTESIFAFRNVYKMLDEACEVIASNLKESSNDKR
jgi:protein-tyrosine phosphatase